MAIGDGVNNFTFDVASGPAYTGSARPVKKLVISPEYPGAVLTASGSGEISGSMTSDASPSAGFRNYYQWRSGLSTQQDYTIVARVSLPSDFDAWEETNAMQIAYNTESDNLANWAKMDVTVYKDTDSSGTPITYRAALTSNSKTWTSLNLNASDFGGTTNWKDPGTTGVIYIRLYSRDSMYSQVGDIVLNYYGKY